MNASQLSSNFISLFEHGFGYTKEIAQQWAEKLIAEIPVLEEGQKFNGVSLILRPYKTLKLRSGAKTWLYTAKGWLLYK